MCRLKHFCFCLSLRHGCYIIAFLDLAFNLYTIFVYPEKKVTRTGRSMAICHCIGCCMLLVGALFQSTVLVVFYLITSLLNTGVNIFLIIWFCIYYDPSLLLVIIPSCFVVCFNIYTWIVVYAYYRFINVMYDEDQ